ncbi:putative gmc oxidoreductase protein [Botrytis fragariae]|uniref:Putative gmc oxidoreductase protein n=1 Tax=Botrytis fragariae TaxID=1964551 RepID=A0A8H6ARC5_9HELO|nr:putative gmc oxidoreductase protein [Botrytis fragariae]KAF5871960.1 putative gmc oxidoreductase protein [Botrytis fragariae]
MLNLFRQRQYSPVLSDIESEEKNDRVLQNRQLQPPRLLCAVVLGALVLGIAFFSGVIFENHFLRYQAPDPYQNRERCSNPSTRREWRSFSAAEKASYLDAVQCLRETPSRLHSDYSLYDDFPWVHTNIGNYFSLKAKNIDIYLCCSYWDWSLDWENITNSPVWDNELGFGGNGDPNSEVIDSRGIGQCVVDGPFALLSVPYIGSKHSRHCLSRSFNTTDSSESLKIKPYVLNQLMDTDDYEKFNLGLENTAHNSIPHMIRGDFSMFTAPYDPVFFLHHTQLDRLWWLWQQKDIQSRLYQYRGAAAFKSLEKASVKDLLLMGELIADIEVKDILDTESGNNLTNYSYIGGTSNRVIAARLAYDSTVSILTVEAEASNDTYPATTKPAAVSQILVTEADWNIKSEPCEELENRQLHLARGKVLGGSSGCLQGWSGDEMFKYMSKAETFHNKPWFDAEKDAHGYNGPIITPPYDPAPISNLVLESYQSIGLPLIPDMFSTGKSAHDCGHAVRTVSQGTRTMATDYLTTLTKEGSISTKTNAYIGRINLETDTAGALRANGVFLQDITGQKSFMKARKEVIVSAGTYGSPIILLRSGIGSKELRSLEFKAEQISQFVLSFYELSKPALTNDHLIWHPGERDKSLAQYKTDKTGFFSPFPFGIFAFARLDSRLADSYLWNSAPRAKGLDPMGLSPTQPHVEFWNPECYSPKYMFGDFPPDGQYAFAMATEFFAPRSRCEGSLKSSDPTENPVVNHRYLEDPLDMLVFIKGCRMANEIAMKGAGTKDIVIGSWPGSRNHHSFNTREDWMSVIRSNADTCYHPVETCKMGRTDDPLAVLDKNQKVRGITGLRVADVSVMPSLIGEHLQMPVYGIAEKAADLIISDN